MDHPNEPMNTDYEEQNSRAKPPRELKVEDALLYLDQVKVEFSDKPHIYNEFLEIMKNFKAQSINTPGVIDRVRSLFKGYNKLILGFNTFLPEGYKIELTAEEIASEVAANAAAAQAAESKNLSVHSSLGMSGSTPGAIASQTVSAAMVQAQMGGNSGINPAQASFQPSAHVAVVPDAQARQPQQLQQQHAITYVTTIRNRFANEPETYRAFLRILHTYQKEQKGIKDVLEQVSHLFADHPDLLMEFTYFLPDAVQDQAKERLHRAAKESEMRRRILQQQQNPHLFPGHMAHAGPGGQPLNPAAMASMSSMPGAKKSRADRGQAGPLGAAGIPNVAMNGPGMGATSQHQAIYDAHMMQQQQNVNARKLASNAGSLVQQQQQQAVRGGKGPKRKISELSSQGPLNVAGLSVSQYNAFLQSQQAQGQTVRTAANGMPYGDNDRMSASMAAQASMLQNDQRKTMSSRSDRTRSGGNGEDGVYGRGDAISTNHISINTERRLFESIKDYLTTTSRDGWIDFIKCLDLFSVDAISKKDMLSLIQDLFDNGGEDLLEEFKRLLNSRADHDTAGQEIWFAMPLSEIDFSQCRKCTPSYRALPVNYPKPQCTDREALEISVLNDQWVSIPIGSEESYSFKHMRKNQYEEALFKCEDDRFEIDMIIDTNVSAIRILEPIAEEIASISRLEDNSNAPGNPKFNFSLEKRNLSTVHLNAITRLYGEHGSEILELLRKNPAGSIPVILRRLKQKDVEWRKARQELNKQWKEVMDKNYDKSFDHRSFYFKQQDKRSYNMKNLLADIKVTSSSTANADTGVLADIVPPEVHLVPSSENNSLLLKGSGHPMTGQLYLNFSVRDSTCHSDVYQLLTHAAETSNSIPVHDRERIAACWRDWLRPLFQLPVHALYPPSASMALGIGSADSIPVDAAEAWPAGTAVLTTFGSGRIVTFRAVDSTYEVQLPFGKGHLKASAIIGAEELSPHALAAIGIIKDATTGVDKLYGSTFAEVATQLSQTSNPGAISIGTGGSIPYVVEPSTIFYGTQTSYAFLRVYHTIYTRLALAKQLAVEAASFAAETSSRNANQTSSYANSMPTMEGKGNTIQNDLKLPSSQLLLLQGAQSKYDAFLSQLICLLDGSLDVARYEESVRQLLGNKAYLLYTLDKVILQALKMLQTLTNDDHFNRLIGVFVYHRSVASAANVSSLSNATSSTSSPVPASSTSKGNKAKSSSSKASADTSATAPVATSNTVGGRRVVNVLNYQNHVKQVTVYANEDIFRFQFLNKGDCMTNQQMAIQLLSVGTNSNAAESTAADHKSAKDAKAGHVMGLDEISVNQRENILQEYNRHLPTGTASSAVSEGMYDDNDELAGEYSDENERDDDSAQRNGEMEE